MSTDDSAKERRRRRFLMCVCESGKNNGRRGREREKRQMSIM